MRRASGVEAAVTSTFIPHTPVAKTVHCQVD